MAGATAHRLTGQRLPAATWLALAALFVLVAGALVPFAGLAGREPGASSLNATLQDPYIWRAVRFTLWQASLSTLLSIVLGLPLALALHADRRFPGRALLLRIFALPMALPQIVAALAITGLYGQRGAITETLAAIGIQAPSIYGLGGILIAHSFFNAPLAARIVLNALDTLPAEYERLAAGLGMSFSSRIRLIYWPAMRQSLSGAATLIFMLCATSFTIVLILGGGPRATTLEVAIYQALTFDFDTARALVLTALQLALTATAVFVFSRFGTGIPRGHAGNGGQRVRPMAGSSPPRLWSMLIILPLTFYVVSPFAIIVWRGASAPLAALAADTAVQQAMATSLTLGCAAAILAVALSWGISKGVARVAAARRHAGSPGRAETLLTHAPSIILVLPPIVLAAGWFVALRPFTDVYAAAPFLVIAINAAMAMPFALRLILPAVLSADETQDRLCRSLGIAGWNRLRVIEWPVLAGPVTAGFAFALALSLGDLGVIALFGSQDVQTLPYLILQRMGSYRTNDAAGLALVLMVMTMVLMYIADRSPARNGQTHV